MTRVADIVRRVPAWGWGWRRWWGLARSLDAEDVTRRPADGQYHVVRRFPQHFQGLVVGKTDERDAVCSQKDVSLAELTGLRCGLVWEQALDSNQAGPLVARLHTASHTKPQPSAALQQAHFERSISSNERVLAGQLQQSGQ